MTEVEPGLEMWVTRHKDGAKPFGDFSYEEISRATWQAARKAFPDSFFEEYDPNVIIHLCGPGSYKRIMAELKTLR